MYHRRLLIAFLCVYKTFLHIVKNEAYGHRHVDKQPDERSNA